ncbi:unnamed protein product [Rotaria sp. Silwood2]|nr:unnamed protein product [Rotaria sp. Silwood2]CAF4177337.1 unnamed protein product [Rotaria sp. Silwood2]
MQTYSHFNESISYNISYNGHLQNTIYHNLPENIQLVEDFEKRYQLSYKIEHELDLHEFELIMTLGQGSFVILEQNKIEYALKVLDKSKIVKYKQIKHVQNEIRILNAIRHPNIIIMHSLFKDNSYIYVLMEYVRGGDLFGYINKLKVFQEHITSFFAAQIVLILIYEMNTGNPPFKGQSEVLLFEAICRKKTPLRANFTLNFKKIILGLLQKDPTTRLGSSAKGSTEIKEHPWFSKINFEAIYTQQIPSPFSKYIITKSLIDCRQESITRNEKPLVIAEQDDFKEYFKDF